MQIDLAYKLLKQQHNPFDLAYKSDGIDVVVHRGVKPAELAEDFLSKMMDTYDTDTLFAFTKKGTGVVKRDDQTIIITANKNTDTPSPTSKPMEKNLPIPAGANSEVLSYMMLTKDQHIQHLQEKISMLENSLRSSESDNRMLKDENMRIDRENKIIGDKHELAIKNMQADHERLLNDKTNTVGHQVLNGLGNPDLVNGVTTMLVGLTGAISQAIASNKAHRPTMEIGHAVPGMIAPVPHAAKPIEHMTKFMNTLSPEDCQIFYYCTANLASNPQHRKEYFETYVKPTIAA